MLWTGFFTVWNQTAPLLRQHPGIFSHGNCRINHNNKLRNRHGKPYRICARQYRKKEYQYATDDHSSCHRHNKRCPRLHDSLKIIGGKALAPRYFIIFRLNNMVRIPIATSIKKVEKPVTSISQNCIWIFHTNLLFPTTYGHFSDYIKKCRIRNRHFSLPLIRLSFLWTTRPPSIYQIL